MNLLEAQHMRIGNHPAAHHFLAVGVQPHLQVDVGFPLLRITRYAFVGEGLVDYSVSLYRSDRYKLFVPLERQGSRSPRYTTLR